MIHSFAVRTISSKTARIKARRSLRLVARLVNAAGRPWMFAEMIHNTLHLRDSIENLMG